MIGGLVLRECLLREDVEQVTHIGRRPTGLKHPKLVEVLHDDLGDMSTLGAQMANVDVCFYCLGVYTGALPPAAFKKWSGLRSPKSSKKIWFSS